MTYNSTLLRRPGAVEAGGLDAGVAAHYGDPYREQRLLAGVHVAAAQGKNLTAVVDLSHRGVVTVSGPDRLSWLNTLSSAQLTDLAPGVSTELLLLSIQGRIEHDVRVLDDGATTWLIVEAAEAAPLAAWLTGMRFMLRVEVADVSGLWAVAGTVNPVTEWSERLCWRDPWPHIAPGGFAYTAVPEESHPGLDRSWFEYLIPMADLDAAVGVRPLAGSWAAEALRIAAWRPRLGAETDDKTIPHELDLLRTAVHLAKGCYKGQETVARVHNLGHPPRRLVFLQLDGSQHTLPAAGSAVLLGERQVGTVTSVAQHFEMGPIALAVIKRTVDPAAELTVLDAGEKYVAAQETIVAPDAGQVVGRQTGFLRVPR
ncbi:glycine cleavage T C-terminal barrel domain-containing protein [Paenarthrobacter sp. PH39-S1]|uniref:CAF17-like 4Fe-4S cluster assembly/insertion protein YgfZ n=1 Tax=Paenarthrobacter sp. PH39-S1 TaxID=3046204 RepID=UPI0024B9390C|nr:glycine cleavage T C-terminal barrel domain-containing protein [Paenarthrobacter sp. PH39-S1]MDJ0355922.1 glycine cleavage T C-terminal barrel domain-containing protein [Paenarthrobacter sp. PH39-S1]